jgi:ribosomal protein S18 acetylase RimI-like enzyme
MNTNNIIIRKATVEDAVALALLGRITFAETFSTCFSDQQGLQQHYECTYSVAEMRKTLQQSNTTYWLALYNELPVGYVKLVKESKTDDCSEKSSVQLQKIYVLKDFLSFGIGRQLHDALLTEVKANSSSYIWLLVWEKNTRAIRFYSKSGYSIIDRQWHTVGNDSFPFLRMAKSVKTDNSYTEPSPAILYKLC